MTLIVRDLTANAAHVWRWSRSADAFSGEEMLADLEALCAQAGFNEPRVELVEQGRPEGRVGSIEASISATFEWASFLALLEALEGSEFSLTVRSIDVTEGGDAQRVTIVVSAPVISPSEAP